VFARYVDGVTIQSGLSVLVDSGVPGFLFAWPAVDLAAPVNAPADLEAAWPDAEVSPVAQGVDVGEQDLGGFLDAEQRVVGLEWGRAS
jgi:hypothetical protein